MNRLSRLVPAAIFLLLAGVLLLGLLLPGERSEVPSPLLGKEVPAFALAGLEESDDGFSNTDLLEADVALVNVWASWCPPCREEHPLLMRLTCVSGLEMYGLNHKDSREAALEFLQELGNPFHRVGFDGEGFAGLEWGVYGVPETFLVAGGEVIYKRAGPLHEVLVVEEILPLLETAGLEAECFAS